MSFAVRFNKNGHTCCQQILFTFFCLVMHYVQVFGQQLIKPANEARKQKAAAVFYHRQQLPQVLFLLQQKFCCDKHVFVATKDMFCHEKVCMPQQNFWRDKWQNNFVTCLSQQNFCCHKRHVLSWQKHVCRDKNKFVATKRLLQQTRVCHNKGFVMTSILLSRQKRSFVATKIILVAAPTSNSVLHWIVPKVQAWERKT